MTIYSLYWIHKKDHKDPHKEGYIGITTDFKNRIAYHSNYANSIVSKAIKKYKEEVVFEILLEGLDEVSAKSLEEYYRPKDKIGWNIVKGGGIPPSKKGFDFSNTKVTLKGENRTSRQKEASKIHSENQKGRTSPNKGKKCPEHLKEYYRKIYTGKKVKPFTEEHKNRLRESAKNREKAKCPHCEKIGDRGAMIRWHFDNCRVVL